MLGLLSFWGCFHSAQVTEDSEGAFHTRIRPIDADAATAEKIGHEALAKIGYEEIINLADRAGFVVYKSDVQIQLASCESAVASGFVRVFSRYAAAAAVTSQADSPLPGPADIAALGVVVIGLVDAGLLDGRLLNAAEGWLFSQASTEVPAAAASAAAVGAASEAAVTENAAYEEARAGGKHSGTLRNYAGRSTQEVEKAITSYERQVELHNQKIAHPEQFAERWGQMSAQEQAGLLNKWRGDAVRNQQLADVMRGLLKSR